MHRTQGPHLQCPFLKTGGEARPSHDLAKGAITNVVFNTATLEWTGSHSGRGPRGSRSCPGLLALSRQPSANFRSDNEYVSDLTSGDFGLADTFSVGAGGTVRSPIRQGWSPGIRRVPHILCWLHIDL